MSPPNKKKINSKACPDVQTGKEPVMVEPVSLPTTEDIIPQVPVLAEKDIPSKIIRESAPKVTKKSIGKVNDITDSDIHPNHRERSDRYLYLLLILIVALLLAVAYYYKIILNKPLPLISSANAQTVAQSEKKVGRKVYDNFEIDGIEFHPFIDIRGFHIKSVTANAPEECSAMDTFGVKMHLILEGDKLNEEWKKFKDKCSFKISGETGALIDYRFSENESLEKYISPYKLNKKNKNRIFKIASLIQEKSGPKNYVQIFINLSNEKLEGERDHILDTLQDYSTKVRNTDNVFAVLTRLLIALEWKNYSWAKREIKDLIHLNSLRYIYSIQMNTNQERMIQLQEALYRLVKKIYKVEVIKQEIRLLVSNLSLFMEDNDIKTLVNELDANWSLVELRRLSKEGRRGREYFEFWYSSLKGRTTKNEILSYFKRSLNPEIIREMSPHSLWVFSEYLPSDKEERFEIINRGVQLGRKKILILDL